MIEVTYKTLSTTPTPLFLELDRDKVNHLVHKHARRIILREFESSEREHYTLAKVELNWFSVDLWYNYNDGCRRKYKRWLPIILPEFLRVIDYLPTDKKEADILSKLRTSTSKTKEVDHAVMLGSPPSTKHDFYKFCPVWDIIWRITSALYKAGYNKDIHYDAEQVEELRVTLKPLWILEEPPLLTQFLESMYLTKTPDPITQIWFDFNTLESEHYDT